MRSAWFCPAEFLNAGDSRSGITGAAITNFGLFAHITCSADIANKLKFAYADQIITWATVPAL